MAETFLVAGPIAKMMTTEEEKPMHSQFTSISIEVCNIIPLHLVLFFLYRLSAMPVVDKIITERVSVPLLSFVLC